MRVNLDLKKPVTAWDQQISYAKKNYKHDALKQEYYKVISGVKDYKVALQGQVDKALQDIDKELESLNKPAGLDRAFSTETVTLLNYLSKVIQSRVASVGDNREKFLEVLGDIASQGDRQMRWALVDSIHEILETGRSLVDRTKSEGEPLGSWHYLESKIHEQYKVAMDSLKSASELAAAAEYETKKSELEMERFQLNFRHSTTNDALDGQLANVQRGYIMDVGDDKGSTTNAYFG